MVPIDPTGSPPTSGVALRPVSWVEASAAVRSLIDGDADRPWDWLLED